MIRTNIYAFAAFNAFIQVYLSASINHFNSVDRTVRNTGARKTAMATFRNLHMGLDACLASIMDKRKDRQSHLLPGHSAGRIFRKPRQFILFILQALSKNSHATILQNRPVIVNTTPGMLSIFRTHFKRNAIKRTQIVIIKSLYDSYKYLFLNPGVEIVVKHKRIRLRYPFGEL
jgi:hypothetical protein